MNHRDIQQFLDRYWDGEATLEEERALKGYFANGPVDPRFAAEAPFFQALREEKAIQIPATARQATIPQTYSTARHWAVAAAMIGLIAAAGWWATRPTVTLPDAVATITREEPIKHPLVQQPAAAVGQPTESAPIAATQGPSKVTRHKPRAHRVSAPPSAIPDLETLDPETRKALEEVRAALALVSAKLNKGRRTATKNLQQVETFDKFFKHKKESEG